MHVQIEAKELDALTAAGFRPHQTGRTLRVLLAGRLTALAAPGGDEAQMLGVGSLAPCRRRRRPPL